jgi:hypothetical protein
LSLWCVLPDFGLVDAKKPSATREEAPPEGSCLRET